MNQDKRDKPLIVSPRNIDTSKATYLIEGLHHALLGDRTDVEIFNEQAMREAFKKAMKGKK